MRASDRGVGVRLVIDGHPRCARANEAVIALLSAHGLNGGFALYNGTGHLHSKIYGFDDFALVGSFNPSGNTPEDPSIIAEIGDQDRGHNLLLRINSEPMLVALRSQIASLATEQKGLFRRFSRESNRITGAAEGDLFFYPRLRTLIVERRIDRLGRGDSVRGALSHFKPGKLANSFVTAARRGVTIRLLVHDTERRVPQKLVEYLHDHGIAIVRIRDPNDLPMHAKFILLERAGAVEAWLGSYNFNPRSRWLNSEVVMRTIRPETTQRLAERFEQIAAMG